MDLRLMFTKGYWAKIASKVKIHRKLPRVKDETIDPRKIERWLFFANTSFYGNLALAAGKLAIGIYTASLFLCISALYNVGIALCKLVAVRGYRAETGLKSYQKVGIILTVSGIVFIVYCLRLFFHGSNVIYPMEVALAIAAITFSEIGAAIYGIVIARHYKAHAISAMKLTSLSSALISMALTQTAILSFTEKIDVSYYNGLSGVICGGVAALIGVYMIVRSAIRNKQGAVS
jgi:divalent metal cation (Fe/Co/Zn/Cd) transporter